MKIRLTVVIFLAGVINGVLGFWILISPMACGFAVKQAAQTWVCLIAGGIVMTFGLLRAATPRELPWLSWTNLVLGVLILLSPWMLHAGDTGPELWTDTLMGLAIVLLAGASAYMSWLQQQAALAKPIRRQASPAS